MRSNSLPFHLTQHHTAATHLSRISTAALLSLQTQLLVNIKDVRMAPGIAASPWQPAPRRSPALQLRDKCLSRSGTSSALPGPAPRCPDPHPAHTPLPRAPPRWCPVLIQAGGGPSSDRNTPWQTMHRVYRPPSHAPITRASASCLLPNRDSSDFLRVNREFRGPATYKPTVVTFIILPNEAS